MTESRTLASEPWEKLKRDLLQSFLDEVMEASPRVGMFDDAGFAALLKATEMPLLVVFYNEDEGLGPILRRIAERVARAHTERLKVGMVEIAAAFRTARRYSVLTSPTYVLFHRGTRLVTAVGYQRESDIDKLIVRFLERSVGPTEP